jgi:hypothetical protein
MLGLYCVEGVIAEKKNPLLMRRDGYSALTGCESVLAILSENEWHLFIRSSNSGANQQG